jgi:hypothetical protein
MKKNIIVFCAVLAAFSLAACGFINSNDSELVQEETAMIADVVSNGTEIEKMNDKIFTDFIYDIGPRFNSIKKTDLDTAKSFTDFIGDEHAQRIVSYHSLSVIILDGDKKTETKATGTEGVFTAAQIKLLQSSDYSTNLLIWAEYKEKNVETGLVEDSDWTPYLTIVPEKQATYVSGKAALMDFLRENSEESRANVDPDKFRPAKLFFTVTSNGEITKVKLDRTSGYPYVDEKMIELITKAPGKWQPAENIKGEKVDQELVVSFGLRGC